VNSLRRPGIAPGSSRPCPITGPRFRVDVVDDQMPSAAGVRVFAILLMLRSVPVPE